MIDGKVGEAEWDQSGEMYVYGLRNIRDRYSARVYSMYDSEALYLGILWRDPTPMINNVDPDRAAGEGWMADSFQARFITDYAQIHFTSWYGSKSDKCVAQIDYDAPVNPANQKIFRGPGTKLADPSGFAMAFSRDADNRGYAQEIRIPWTLLYKGAAPAPGTTLGFSGEYFWGGPSGTKWPAVLWSDPINQAMGQRIVLYQNPAAWGKLELSPQGNLPVTEETAFDAKLQGTIPIRLTLPSDASRFSIAIDDADGKRVRNLISHANVSDYLVKSDGGGKSIEVLWDGRADGQWNKDRSLFLGDFVAAGKYTARTIVHAGVGVLHAGSFYNPGTPPWATADGTGQWLGDHTPPSAVAAMPKSSTARGRVFLGCQGQESGVGFIGLDSDGKKIWEWVRIGTGAWHIATSDKYVYFTYSHGSPGANKLGRCNPDTGEQIAFANGKPEITLSGDATGLSIRDGQIAISLAAGNKLILLDAESGDIKKEVPVESPGSIAFAPDGTLWGIGKTSVFMWNPAAEGVVPFNLDGWPSKAIAVDASGKIYLADADQRVTVLTANLAQRASERSTKIGDAGGHKPGPWTPQAMNNPSSLAIEERADGSSHLWVTEADSYLKRVSVFNIADGKLVKDYIGTTNYMGSGGALSDDQPDLGLNRGTLYKIDYANCTYTPVEVVGGKPDPVEGRIAPFDIGEGNLGFGNANHFFSDVSGKNVEYYVIGADYSRVLIRRNARWVCVAAMGAGSRDLDPNTLAPGKGFPPKPNNNSSWVWSDLNGDSFAQPDEVQWRDFGKANVLAGAWGYRCFKDLAWYHSGYAFKPARFSEDGAPIYDIAKVEKLPGAVGELNGDISKTKFGYIGSIPHVGDVVDANGVVFGLSHVAGFDQSGKLCWTYPSYWNAVHGAMSAPAAMPGVIMGSIKTTGITKLTDQHDMLSIRGNMGQEFLIRDDGMYIGELFTDQRQAPSRLPEQEDLAGVPINDTTLGGECFNGWMNRQADGKVRMSYGETDVRIAEVVGLDSIVDVAPLDMNLSAEQVTAAKAFIPSKGTAKVTTYIVAKGGAFDVNTVDLTADSVIVIRQGTEEIARASLRHDEQNLYLACQVYDPTPLINKGTLAAEAFKTGDSVNLFLATDTNPTGTRILLAQLGGKNAAVVFKPNGPGENPYTFRSPVRSTDFKYVAEDPSIQWTTKSDAGGYTLVATIPLKLVDDNIKSAVKLKADLGLLLGDETGSRTSRRVHWVDEQTNVVNDVPTEAEFDPARWGTFTLE